MVNARKIAMSLKGEITMWTPFLAEWDELVAKVEAEEAEKENS
jgi:hypothetical protein